MPILSADIKLLASKVMDDVPNGGGGPTGNVIPDGVSNAVFGDVTERARSGGAVSIRQVFLSVQTPNTSAYMDPTIIVSRPPNDPNVSITLAKCNMFAKRTEIARAIENYLIQGTEWGGYLFENHVADQRSINLFQRPGTPPPTIGRTLVLIENELLPSRQEQYVRVTRIESITRMFTYITPNGEAVDFLADLHQCDISDKLRFGMLGSPPNRTFARTPGRTTIRDTQVANAAQYYGSSPSVLPASMSESILRVASIYTQLVPSDRSEVTALNQRPAAVRQLQLAATPRDVTIAAAPHTYRLKIGQENRGFSFVQILKPFPAPGSVVVSWMALGSWQTLSDDGAGNLTGAGVGTVDYTRGDIAITLTDLPDVGSAVIFQWGEKSAFVNRSNSVNFRAPEYALKLDHAGIKPGTLTLGWTSGNVAQTATDNGTGQLAGAAVGEINYASGDLFIRPTQMLDAGGEFEIGYQHAIIVTKNVSVTPDAGGFASITLDTTPAAGSVTVSWITVREVSETSGASAGGSASTKAAGSVTTVVMGRNPDYVEPVPAAPPGAPPTPDADTVPVAVGRDPGMGQIFTAQSYMLPAGMNLSTGMPIFTSVPAIYTAEKGYHYPKPDLRAAIWSDAEVQAGSKEINGVTYKKFDLPPIYSGG